MKKRHAFTLIELLVVLLIIALVSAATLPAVLPALNHRQMSESARLVQAAIEGCRDSAIRNNSPRGIRLIPDTTLSAPLGTSNGILAYNRILPIEPGPDYNEGKVSILAGPNPAAGDLSIPYSNPAAAYPDGALRIEESRVDSLGLPNARTSWAYNVRVGDRIRVGTSGRLYTIVGPMVDLPPTKNPEKFVNYGAPGVEPPMSRNGLRVEFLYVVNGQDDDGDGRIDTGWDGSGWDGLDSDGDGAIDEADEYENEQFVGPEASGVLDQTYVIKRRPVPTQGARTIDLPADVVIDASSWDSTQERSRLPIDPDTRFVEFMVSPNGTIVPQPYLPGRAIHGGAPFYHLWLSERGDVFAPATTGTPRLPVPDGFVPSATVALKGDRRLVTVQWKTGNVMTNSLEGFNPADVTDINAPFWDAQNGRREAK